MTQIDPWSLERAHLRFILLRSCIVYVLTCYLMPFYSQAKTVQLFCFQSMLEVHLLWLCIEQPTFQTDISLYAFIISVLFGAFLLTNKNSVAILFSKKVVLALVGLLPKLFLSRNLTYVTRHCFHSLYSQNIWHYAYHDICLLLDRLICSLSQITLILRGHF